MLVQSIPNAFFDMLPIPIAIAQHNKEDLNHPVVYTNKAFKDIIGYELSEIPDKNAWSIKAYPEEQYRNAVMRMWELSVEDAMEGKQSYVNTIVNIKTKKHGTKRFEIFTEIQNQLVEGYYVVAFK